jgi:hypothetical protein
VQFLDALVDAATGRLVFVPGLAVFTAVFAFGAYRLNGLPAATTGA